MKQTIELLEKKIKSLGLQPAEVPAKATQQSRKYVDPKKNVAYMTFKNGHVARTVAGTSGKRFSLNLVKAGERQLIKTEIARLNRLVVYLEANQN